MAAFAYGPTAAAANSFDWSRVAASALVARRTQSGQSGSLSAMRCNIGRARSGTTDPDNGCLTSVLKARKPLRDFKIREEQAIACLHPRNVNLGIVVSANVANAGPSTDDRDLLASVDPAVVADEATEETEDQIGLDKGKRRDVQRRLTGLGFDTKVSGRSTSRPAPSSRAGKQRAAIPDWLPQHAAASRTADRVRFSGARSVGKFDDDRPARHSGGGVLTITAAGVPVANQIRIYW